jgi:hypothetical protein
MKWQRRGQQEKADELFKQHRQHVEARAEKRLREAAAAFDGTPQAAIAEKYLAFSREGSAEPETYVERYKRLNADLAPLPHCSSCGGVERPDVVLFGENLPEQTLEWLHRELEVGVDMVLSLGTSGLFPYIRLPMIRAQVLGWSSADINPAATPMSARAQHHLQLRAAVAADALRERLCRRDAVDRIEDRPGTACRQRQSFFDVLNRLIHIPRCPSNTLLRDGAVPRS